MITKQQALGFAKYAAEKMKMPDRTVQAFINAYDWAWHHKSPAEAEEHYYSGGVNDGTIDG